MVGERRQSAARLGRELTRVGIEEVRVGRDVRAADTAADLVELREPEGVGPLDDQGVRLRDVDPRFDDRRRDENVRVACEEGVHPLLEHALAHLPVRDEEAKVRTELLELLGRDVDRLDAVVEVEGLALACALAVERELDQLVVDLAHRRPDRPPPLGRGLDDRDVAQPREGHVQRARDRRRGQRQDVDLEPQCAQELLLPDAEALLLVDDDEAELLGDHVAGEDPMGADEHVDLPLGELLQHRLDLRGPAEARDHLDPDGEVAVALAEGVPVLLREDRRRAEHEDLPTVDGDRERRADGNLRLSEADVATDQPVHRLGRLEILFDRLDRALLVVRLAVGERRLELLEPVALDLERRARGSLALRVQLQQLARQLLHRGPRARLEVLPCLPAELREGGCGRIGADVPRQLPDLLVRHEQPVLAAEREVEVVARDAGDRLGVEPEELPDTVVLVDDMVAHPQVGEARESAAEAGVRPRRLLAEDLGVRQEDETELPPDEPAPRRRDRESEIGVHG